MKFNTSVTAILLILLPLACAEDVGSSAVRTKGLYAKYKAIATGNGKTQIFAELRVGGDNGTYLFLENPDRLIASTDGENKTLADNANGDQHSYEGVLAGDDEGMEVQIDFDRADKDEDAPDSRATLPAKFELELASDPDIERGNAVSIEWEAGSGTVDWSLAGDCIKSESGRAADSGALTIDADQIEAWSADEDEACEVTVTVDRVRKGEVDSGFKQGGEFLSIQRRTVSFNSLPVGGDTSPGGSKN